ncbi:hypothetical protein YC2023_015838 [Brassica napus]
MGKGQRAKGKEKTDLVIKNVYHNGNNAIDPPTFKSLRAPAMVLLLIDSSSRKRLQHLDSKILQHLRVVATANERKEELFETPVPSHVLLLNLKQQKKATDHARTPVADGLRATS